MANPTVTFTFDKPDIAIEGVPFAAIANLLTACEFLFSAASWHRVHPTGYALPPRLSGGYGAEGPTLLTLQLASTPRVGSIVVPTWAVISAFVVGGLSLTADLVQISGYSVKDGIEAIRAVQERGHQVSDLDDQSVQFIRSSEGMQLANDVISRAVDTGCASVSIQINNDDPVPIVGGSSNQRSLIGIRSTGSQLQPELPQRMTFTRPNVEPLQVQYQGKILPAFAIYRALPDDDRIVVLVWQSKKPLPITGETFVLQFDPIDPKSVFHVGEIDEAYKHAVATYLVKAASKELFE